MFQMLYVDQTYKVLPLYFEHDLCMISVCLCDSVFALSKSVFGKIPKGFCSFKFSKCQKSHNQYVVELVVDIFSVKAAVMPQRKVYILLMVAVL